MDNIVDLLLIRGDNMTDGFKTYKSVHTLPTSHAPGMPITTESSPTKFPSRTSPPTSLQSPPSKQIFVLLNKPPRYLHVMREILIKIASSPTKNVRKDRALPQFRKALPSVQLPPSRDLATLPREAAFRTLEQATSPSFASHAPPPSKLFGDEPACFAYAK